MKQETDRVQPKVPHVLIANCLIGPVLIWFSIVVLLVAPLPFYTSDVSHWHWANFALGGSLFYFLLRGPRLGSVVVLYWMAAIWLITFYGPSWPRWQFLLALWGLAWGGQILRYKVEGEKPGLLADLRFLLVGPIWVVRLIYKRLGAVF